MKNLLFLLLVMISSVSYAQDGLLVTTQGDTLRGEIEILLPSASFDELIVKTEARTHRLKAFQFTYMQIGDMGYRSAKVNGAYRIMKILQDGYLSLLSFRAHGSYEFGSRYLLKSDGQGIEVPTLSFKKTMSDFLIECSAVGEKIEDKTYKRGDLSQIVADYNQCLKSRTENIYNNLPGKTNTPKSTSSPESELVLRIIDKINKGEGNAPEDLKELLQDILNKLNEGDKVPSYMIGALDERADEWEYLEQELDELTKSLKKN